MNHIEKAEFLLRPVKMVNPIGMEPRESEHPPSEANVMRALAESTLALAKEQHMANLIQCSQRVFIRDAPDSIREHFGEAALGASFTTFPDEEALAEWIGEYLNQYGNVYCELGNGEDPGDIGFDGFININRMARQLLLQMKAALHG